MPRRARRSASRLAESVQKAAAARSRNPRFTIWGTGPQRAQSRRFGDGNLREDARIAGEHQARLREDFYARQTAR